MKDNLTRVELCSCRALCDFAYLISLDQCQYGFLSPQHGTSSGCGWRRRHPDMEGRCEYTE